jgi:glutaredoxin-like protein NrdH
LSNKGLEFEVVDMSLDDDAADMVRGLGYQQAPVVLTDSGQHWSGFRPDLIAAL